MFFSSMLRSLFVCTVLIWLNFNFLFSQTTVNFQVPGVTTWIVPACVTTITVEAWGGGGGGGSAWSRNSNGGGNEACAGAGGGGGGGYTRQVYTVIPGQSYSVTVGSGGAGGTVTTAINSGTNGSNGGSSSFVGFSINLIATGGVGGIKSQANNTLSAGAGHVRIAGAGSLGGSGNGSIVFNGGSGSSGAPGGSFDFSGSGGGGAGSLANGNNGALSVAANPPVGGAGGLNGGGKGGNGLKTAVNYAGNGLPGLSIGGGGGGALTHRTDWVSPAIIASGGAGARGEVRVTYTPSAPVLPTFNSIAPICSGEIVMPLPTTSNNSITGTWSPIINNTVTTNYSFTPSAGLCASNATLTITIDPCGLPVELTSFTGYQRDRYNLLEWQTASENNNDYFTLERSIDGGNWMNVSDVNGAGTSTLLLNYEYQDYLFTKNSLNYYRLSQTDFDGTKKFAGNIVSIDNREGSKQIVRIINLLGQEVTKDTQGVVIFVYDDGTIERIVNL